MKIDYLFSVKDNFRISAENQKKYIQKLGYAKDDIERSYKQYKCQRYQMSFFYRICGDLVSFICIPIFIVYYVLKSRNVKKKCEIENLGNFKNLEEVIPHELKSIYNIDNMHWFECGMLNADDMRFLKEIIRRYHSCMFFFKCIVKLSKYSYMIYVYAPKRLFVHDEFSFTSSIMTAYCEYRGVEHINIMHGEKLSIIRDSYFRYHRCYVWDKFYIKKFVSMWADPNQFIVACPESLKIDIARNYDYSVYADYKYYLNFSDEKKLRMIANSLKFIEKEGKTMKVRPHPRYSNISLVEKIFGSNCVEDPRSVPILKSIASSGCVIASYSTVLNQAYSSSLPVILDDVAEKKMYDKLKEYEYILIDKNVPKLSEKQIE